MHPGGEQRYRVAEEGFLGTTPTAPQTDRDIVTRSLPINSAHSSLLRFAGGLGLPRIVPGPAVTLFPLKALRSHRNWLRT
jgi:hypothetical protein